MGEFMNFLKRFGIGFAMMVVGATIATYSLILNPTYSAGKFLNALSAIGVFGGFALTVIGALYMKFKS